MITNILLGFILGVALDLNFSQKEFNTAFTTSLIMLVILIFDIILRSI